MKNKAFTMIEILVVATIIGLLAAGAAISYSTFVKQSRDSRRKADLEQIRGAIEQYRSNDTLSRYPTSITFNCPASGSLTDISGKIYLQTIPNDPQCPQKSYVYFISAPYQDYILQATVENITADTSQGVWRVGPFGGPIEVPTENPCQGEGCEGSSSTGSSSGEGSSTGSSAGGPDQ